MTDLVRSLAVALVPFLVTRAAMVATVTLAALLVPLNAQACGPCDPAGPDELDSWARWDGGWYVNIAQHGYSYDPNAQSNVAFFPLYPLVMRILVLPFGTHAAALAIAGLIASNVFLVGALVLLQRLAASEIGDASAARAPLLLLVFPTSVFLSAVYPESLLLFLAVAAFVAGRSRRWPLAGALAGLAALTKPFGIAVSVGVLVEGIRRHEPRRRLAWLALAPAAGIAWWIYLTAITGEPMAFFLTQSKFRHTPSLFGSVAELFDPKIYGFPYLVAALLALTIALTVVVWRRLSPGLTAYALVTLAFIIGNGTLSSSMRFELAIFSTFVALAALAAQPAVGVTYVTVGTALSLLFAAMFSRQYWIG